jgi:two-component system KDP operon response regulator KdpE
MSAEKIQAEVLVVDDEIQIRRLLRLTLEEAGYTVREADTGKSGLAALAHRQPDAIILDLGLPDLPGLEVLKQLRGWTPVPVLILSVFSQESSKIAGLDAGADDYLTKPFGGGELLARLRAMLRRNRPVEEANSVSFGSIEVDLARRRVTRAGQVVKFTAKEYALLQLLVTHRDRVLTHRQILRDLWGEKAVNQTHYLRVFMMRLRQKLEDEPDTPKYFQTETGIGYRLVSGSP